MRKRDSLAIMIPTICHLQVFAESEDCPYKERTFHPMTQSMIEQYHEASGSAKISLLEINI